MPLLMNPLELKEIKTISINEQQLPFRIMVSLSTTMTQMSLFTVERTRSLNTTKKSTLLTTIFLTLLLALEMRKTIATIFIRKSAWNEFKILINLIINLMDPIMSNMAKLKWHLINSKARWWAQAKKPQTSTIKMMMISFNLTRPQMKNKTIMYHLNWTKSWTKFKTTPVLFSKINNQAKVNINLKLSNLKN